MTRDGSLKVAYVSIYAFALSFYGLLMIETNLDVLYPSGLFNTTDDQWQVETIIETTAHIQSCVENLVSALDARASLLVEFKQFNAAVQDAFAMITLAPHSVIGYLTAGRAYSLLGQDASALRIYQQMLQKVPNCDPDYHQFVKAKATEYAMNKRVDFVSQLPFDLVISNLIPRILHDQPALEIGKQKGYFDVCHTWRQRIALAGGLPFRIGPGALSVHGYRQLSDIAPYLQWLSVSQEEQHEHIPKLIHCAQFTSLQRLDIKGIQNVQVEINRVLMHLDRIYYTNIQWIITSITSMEQHIATSHY